MSTAIDAVAASTAGSSTTSITRNEAGSATAS